MVASKPTPPSRRKPTWTRGAFAIIRDENGHVLLSHRTDHDIWNLPDGLVEEGELPSEAVIREIREETGLSAVVGRLIGVYGKPGQSELVFAFECSVEGGQLTESAEAVRLAESSMTTCQARGMRLDVRRE